MHGLDHRAHAQGRAASNQAPLIGCIPQAGVADNVCSEDRRCSRANGIPLDGYRKRRPTMGAGQQTYAVQSTSAVNGRELPDLRIDGRRRSIENTATAISRRHKSICGAEVLGPISFLRPGVRACSPTQQSLFWLSHYSHRTPSERTWLTIFLACGNSQASLIEFNKQVNSRRLWASDLQASPPSLLVVTSHGTPLLSDSVSSHQPVRADTHHALCIRDSGLWKRSLPGRRRPGHPAI